MGVKGLTTYLKENRHRLSYTFELKSKESLANENSVAEATRTDDIHVVVDGWSLIYTVYNNSGEPWVYGGEYAALARHVENIVSAWKRAGIKPTFVFDGPTPPLKYPTLISRLQNNCVKQANLFFRTSVVARATPRSLAETRIAPPLGYVAIVSTLLSMGSDVKVEFAEGEADSYIVALAGKLGAYAMGNDSDFLVLNCDGYKGYIPLDEMVWCASTNSGGVLSPASSSLDGDDLEFQTVSRKKQKAKIKVKESRIELGNGPLPPSSHPQSDLSLLLTVYEPSAFAKHVSLPPTLLPLLGALIGNDYASFDFFQTIESAANRVQRVSNTLSSVLNEAQSGNAKKLRKIDRGGQGSVMDVIGTTVERLLIWRDPRYPPASGQIDKITETIVQSTLEYAMDGSVPLFEDEAAGGREHPCSSDDADQVRNLYLRAYHKGVLHPRLLEVFARGSCFPALFLEHPDGECCARSIGRPIREMIWNIFVTGGGIPGAHESSANDTQQSNDDILQDEDELVDVVEESSDDEIPTQDDEDPLAALRGKLQRLSFSGDGLEALKATDISETVSHSPTTSYVEIPQQLRRPKVVTEYVRRGARITPEECEVSGLDNTLWDSAEHPTSVQMWPTHDRLSIFLRLLGSDTPSVRAIGAENWDEELNILRGGTLLLVVTLRWILRILHTRVEKLDDGNGKRERDKEKWTRSEAEALLFCISQHDGDDEKPPIEDRGIQLTAQVLSALEAIGWLAQTLLLVDVPSCEGEKKVIELPVRLGAAEKMFSGRRFHAALAQGKRGKGVLFQQLWDASTEGLENMFGEERGKRRKKDKVAKRITTNPINQGERRKKDGGMFGALAGLDGE